MSSTHSGLQGYDRQVTRGINMPNIPNGYTNITQGCFDICLQVICTCIQGSQANTSGDVGDQMTRLYSTEYGTRG